MMAAFGTFASALSSSAPSIMPVNSNDRIGRVVGAVRCAREWLRAPRLRVDNVLPIERSKMLPIIPAVQASKASRVGGDRNNLARREDPHPTTLASLRETKAVD